MNRMKEIYKILKIFTVSVAVLLMALKVWGQQSLPYEYGFENNNLAADGWTMSRCANYTGIMSSSEQYHKEHTGSYSFRFYNTTNPPQYLISPELTGTGEGVKVRFYYTNMNGYGSPYTETFHVGYSTTNNNVSSFTWGAEISIRNEFWELFSQTFPAGTKYIAIKFTSNDQYFFYLDDFSFTVPQGVVCDGTLIEVGSGDDTNDKLPSNSYYKYALTQQIYTAAEIGRSGIISSISFYNTGTEKTRNYDIYLVNTTKNTFTGASDWITVRALDKVFSGTVVMAADEWTTINLDIPFEYDGLTNLALIMDDNTNSWQSGMSCLVFEANAQAIGVWNDNPDYNPASPSGYSGTVLNVKNQVAFCFSSDLPDPPDPITIMDENCIDFEDATVNRLPAGWTYTSDVYNPNNFSNFSSTPASVFVIEAQHGDMMTENIGPYCNTDNYQSCAATGSRCLCIEYAPAFASYCQDVYLYPPAVHLYPAIYSYSVLYSTEADMSFNSYLESASIGNLYFGTTPDYRQMTPMSDLQWIRTRSGWETPIYYSPLSGCNSFIKVTGTFEVTAEGDYYVGMKAHADAYGAYTNEHPAWITLDYFCIVPLTPIVTCTHLDAPSLTVQTPTADREITVSWTSVAHASSYILYYGVNDPNNNTNVWTIENINATTYTVPELTNGQTYNFAVMPVGSDPYCPENDLSPTVTGTPVCNE